ncbi:MAG: ABC transporter ATP-binding protein [Euryarchaeota archaeon]|nr:ABC transporter ATP-binding protein [Euryarchaeota archaeon]
MKNQKMNVIEVKNLMKRYGSIQAVNNVTFDVKKNEIFALVGPNGAGKTTTIEIIEGLRDPDEGSVTINGMAPNSDSIKEVIGVQLQNSAFYDKIRVKECLEMFGGFYRNSISVTQALEKIDLQKRSNAYYGDLSGGLKQIVAIGIALIGNPKLLFLDEISTGLDPQVRRATWDLIRGIKEEGKTIFITTHYMEEAEKLADRVAIIDHGKLIALDTPRNLIRDFGGQSEIVYEGEAIDLPSIPVSLINGKVIIKTKKPNLVISKVTAEIAKRGMKVHNLRVENANLEDVFINLTGKEMRE